MDCSGFYLAQWKKVRRKAIGNSEFMRAVTWDNRIFQIVKSLCSLTVTRQRFHSATSILLLLLRFFLWILWISHPLKQHRSLFVHDSNIILHQLISPPQKWSSTYIRLKISPFGADFCCTNMSTLSWQMRCPLHYSTGQEIIPLLLPPASRTTGQLTSILDPEFFYRVPHVSKCKEIREPSPTTTILNTSESEQEVPLCADSK